MEKTLIEVFEEEEIEATIPLLGGIEDRTSRAVRAQYEENPYPRWLAANRGKPVGFAAELRHRLPHFQPPAFLDGPLEILVAGCGTGLQPISLALSYRGVRVVAVDLSRRSLAYALRMARGLGLENIEFLQGDILELAGLERSFPVIECSGVLHHMDRPDAGLGVLRDLLRPGGVIKIGLYSELARRDLDVMRARFGGCAGDATPAGIRAFRHGVLASHDAAAFAAITGSADFNNTSGCRDLLFHTKERRYSLPELRDMIGRQSLGFLGFDLDNPMIRRLYRARFPDDPAMTDFDSWHSFEQEYPDSFANMYRFWCQKPRAA
jgi:SAM-dependent methyltransferase